MYRPYRFGVLLLGLLSCARPAEPPAVPVVGVPDGHVLPLPLPADQLARPVRGPRAPGERPVVTLRVPNLPPVENASESTRVRELMGAFNRFPKRELYARVFASQNPQPELVWYKWSADGRARESAAALTKPIVARPFHVYYDNYAHDGHVVHLPKVGPVKSVRMEGSRVAERGFKALAAAPALTHLDLREVNLDDDALTAIAGIPNLEVLAINKSEVTDTGLNALAKCAKLRELTLVGNVTDAGLAALADCKALAHLTVSGPDLTGAAVAQVVKCRGLVAFTVPKNWTATDVAKLRALPNLRDVRVWTSKDDTSALEAAAQLPQVRGVHTHRWEEPQLLALARLGKLHLFPGACAARGAAPDGPDDVVHVNLWDVTLTLAILNELKAFRNLDTLLLGRPAVRLDFGRMAEVARLPKLGALVLQHPPTDLAELAKSESLEALSHGGYLRPGDARHIARIPNLTFLSATVADADARELVALKHLRALRTAELSDEGLRDVSKIKTLTHPRTGGRFVTDAGIADIAKLPALTSLDLGSTPLKDAGVRAIAGMKTLRAIRIDAYEASEDTRLALLDNPELVAVEVRGRTAKFLDRLAGLNKLEYVDLRGRPTEGQLRALAKLPNLRAVNVCNNNFTPDYNAHELLPNCVVNTWWEYWDGFPEPEPGWTYP